MTTDAKPLPLSAEELYVLSDLKRIYSTNNWHRVLATIAERDATIAQQADQNESQAARIESLERALRCAIYEVTHLSPGHEDRNYRPIVKRAVVDEWRSLLTAHRGDKTQES